MPYKNEEDLYLNVQLNICAERTNFNKMLVNTLKGKE